MSVKQKYLKDENGEIFSPIVSAASVLTNRSQSTKPIEELVPYTYRVSTSDFSGSVQIFSGNIPNWSMIKVYLNASSSSTTTAKAIRMRFNDVNISEGFIIDARYRDDVVQKYNNISQTDNLFLGDFAYTGNTSYLELIVINGAGNWMSFKSCLSTVTSVTAQYSLSVCSGQFSHSSLHTSLTSLKIVAPQGFKIGNGIVQIYT